MIVGSEMGHSLPYRSLSIHLHLDYCQNPNSVKIRQMYHVGETVLSAPTFFNPIMFLWLGSHWKRETWWTQLGWYLIDEQQERSEVSGCPKETCMVNTNVNKYW